MYSLLSVIQSTAEWKEALGAKCLAQEHNTIWPGLKPGPPSKETLAVKELVSIRLLTAYGC